MLETLFVIRYQTKKQQVSSNVDTANIEVLRLVSAHHYHQHIERECFIIFITLVLTLFLLEPCK